MLRRGVRMLIGRCGSCRTVSCYHGDMPIYVYSCPSCGLEIEELRSVSKADDPVRCPICGSLCARGVTNFFVSLGRKEKDPTPRKPAHPPGCPCCAARRPKPTTKSQTKP